MLKAAERGHDWNSAVFVDVPKLLKDGQRVSLGMLPASKRLQPLERCYQAWVDCPQLLRGQSSPVLRPNHDGELNIAPPVAKRNRPRDGLPLSVLISNTEAKHEMVERGTEIVDDLSDQYAPFDAGYGIDHRENEPKAPDDRHNHEVHPISSKRMDVRQRETEVDSGFGTNAIDLGRVNLLADDLFFVRLRDDEVSVAFEEPLDSLVEVCDVFFRSV